LLNPLAGHRKKVSSTKIAKVIGKKKCLTNTQFNRKPIPLCFSYRPIYMVFRLKVVQYWRYFVDSKVQLQKYHFHVCLISTRDNTTSKVVQFNNPHNTVQQHTVHQRLPDLHSFKTTSHIKTTLTLKILIITTLHAKYIDKIPSDLSFHRSVIHRIFTLFLAKPSSQSP
jgi:hypothetical protein